MHVRASSCYFNPLALLDETIRCRTLNVYINDQHCGFPQVRALKCLVSSYVVICNLIGL